MCHGELGLLAVLHTIAWTSARWTHGELKNSSTAGVPGDRGGPGASPVQNMLRERVFCWLFIMWPHHLLLKWTVQSPA